MISTLKKIQDKKAAQADNGGFTLIELLIVIVVLGILAAVVVFSLGSVTGKSAISACQADGATVNTAMAAYNANQGAYPTSSDQLLASTNGGPYLQSWPNNSTHYLFELVPVTVGAKTVGKLYEATTGTALTTSGTPVAPWAVWSGAGTCTSSTVG